MTDADARGSILSAPELAAARADVAFARQSHLAWAEHLEAHAESGEPCPDCAVKPYKLDAAHEREWVAKYDRIAALLVHVEAQQQQAKTGPWLVARKRDTEPWEVHWFDRYDHAALHFDAMQANWSTVFFCRVAHCEGKPLDVSPIISEFAERLAQADAARLKHEDNAKEWHRHWQEGVVELAALAERITHLVEVVEALRWREVQCGACGEHYRRCVWCGVGTKATTAKLGQDQSQCGGHLDTPCPKDGCDLAAALAASPSTQTPEKK